MLRVQLVNVSSTQKNQGLVKWFKVVAGGSTKNSYASSLTSEELHRGSILKTTFLGEKSQWDNTIHFRSVIAN